MKSFTSATLICLLATASSSLAVFVDPETVAGDKIYELRDAHNSSRKLGVCYNDILCVVSSGEMGIASIDSEADLKYAFKFAQRIPLANSATPSFASSYGSPLESIGEVVGGSNVRIIGPFTAKTRSEATALRVQTSENGLGVVFQTTAGDYMGIEDGRDGAPTARVNEPFEWRLFEVQKPKVIMINPIRPDESKRGFACGGINQVPCPSKAVGGHFTLTTSVEEPMFTILPVHEDSKRYACGGANQVPCPSKAVGGPFKLTTSVDEPMFTILPVEEPTFTILPVHEDSKRFACGGANQIPCPSQAVGGPIRPKDIHNRGFSCGGANQAACPSKAVGGPFRLTASVDDEPTFTILPVQETPA